MSPRLRVTTALLLLISCVPCARAAVWANIKTVDTTVLNNGIQIMVRADGILEFYDIGDDDWREPGERGEMTIIFPEAKNDTGKTIIKVDQPPVSYIEFSIPQDAEEGIGVMMRVVFVYPTMARARPTDDRLGCIITVDSDVTLEQGGSLEEVEITSDQSLTVQRHAETGLLDILAVKANLHEVLARIGRLTGTNIVVDDLIDPGPTGGGGGQEITITLANATLEEALAAIAAAAGLGVSSPEESGGVYMFSAGIPTDLSAYRLAGTASISLENIEAATAQGLLPNFLYPHLHVNHDQNAIVVSAPEIMLNKIGADLDTVDVPSPQIMIEALAVEYLSKDDLERSLGLGYEGWDFLTNTDSATGEIQFESMVRLPESFRANLQALENEGTVKVWAKPRMAVMNGREARIFIGQTRFIEVEIPSFAGTIKQIQGVDVGVRLAINAWTGGNGEITVSVDPVEVSSISEINPTNGLPVISTRSAETTVRVRDAETIVIGGLVRHEEFVTHRKIPILGEIPLIGEFFKSKSESSLDSELVIFVTPRLLDPISGRPTGEYGQADLEMYERENPAPDTDEEEQGPA
ncbi:MAG: hypothetical protein GF320_14860, partial [Armatimonadia bacterium]|nr:hypothetical protein [Armatimonadia bacterium]